MPYCILCLILEVWNLGQPRCSSHAASSGSCLFHTASSCPPWYVGIPSLHSTKTDALPGTPATPPTGSGHVQTSPGTQEAWGSQALHAPAPQDVAAMPKDVPTPLVTFLGMSATGLTTPR